MYAMAENMKTCSGLSEEALQRFKNVVHQLLDVDESHKMGSGSAQFVLENEDVIMNMVHVACANVMRFNMLVAEYLFTRVFVVNKRSTYCPTHQVP